MSKSRSDAIVKLKENISKKLDEIEKQLNNFEFSPESIDHERYIFRMRNRYHRLEIIQQCLDEKKVSKEARNKSLEIASKEFVRQLTEFVEGSTKGKSERLEALTALHDICNMEIEFLRQKIKNLGGYVFETNEQTPAIKPEIRTPLDSPRTTPVNTPGSSPRPSFKRNLTSRGLFDTPRGSSATTPESSLVNEISDEKSVDKEGGHSKAGPGKKPSKD